jgi:hypothetical protein
VLLHVPGSNSGPIFTSCCTSQTVLGNFLGVRAYTSVGAAHTKHPGLLLGGFRVQVSFFECAQYLATRKILLKLLRIEMETNHIIMTMGMH